MVTARELADYFNVSVRTIYRDIDILSVNGIPIYCSQGKGGGISILDNYLIDKAMLSDEEQKQVLLSLYSLNATGQIDVKNSLTKLKNVFKKNNTDWIEIDFSNWEQSDNEKKIFESIKYSIINCRIIKFSYFNNKGEISKRKIKPYKLVFKGYQWYIYGFCMMRKDFRFFKLTRIDNLIVLDDIFHREEHIFVNTKYEIGDNETIKLKLKIKARMAARVYDEFRKEKIEFKGDYFIVEANIPKSEYLYTYFLAYGSDLEVLEPEYIRKNLKMVLEEMIKKY